jgi:FtsH-binding integral membrane protein
MALAVGLAFAGLASLQFNWGLTPWLLTLVALLLLVGGVRTLRQMSGGLRMLAGAWGFAVGLMLAPLVMEPAPEADNPNIYSVDGATAWLVLALQLLPLAGLALTVLHKERK